MINKISHGHITPLIGGMALGASQAFEQNPEWALGFECFSKNESHFKKNFPDTEFKEISEDWGKYDLTKYKGIDVIGATPSCSGLSGLNASHPTKTTMARGSDAHQNRFMHYSTDIALGIIKPKVFVFENAPGLMQNVGKDMRNYLKRKAEQYGYALSFVFTDTLLHGLPQSRKRTFAFFWKAKYAPLFKYIKKDYVNLKDFLRDINYKDKESEIYATNVKLQDDHFFQFAKTELGKNWRDINYKTLGQWVVKENLIDKMKKQFRNEERTMRILNHWQKKLKAGMGYWDSTPILFDDYTTAIIGKNIGIVHPTKERFLNVRERMALMGLPKEFQLEFDGERIVGSANVVSQNVPVSTSKDMFLFIKDFIEGKTESSEKKYLMQSNLTRKEVYEK